MSSRSEKNQKLQNKHHQILRDLVLEEENKTCADCLAKGPRWASWSLGVYLCIRCAGIHRNLGVHISKVKSVDLDSWTEEQVEHILKWGNRRASEYYECYLPKDFVRPQGNSAVESFIRNKYERKLYIKKDGEPPANPVSTLNRLKVLAENEAAAVKAAAPKRRERPEKKDGAKSTSPPNEETILNVSKQSTRPPKPEPASLPGDHAQQPFAGTSSTSSSLLNPSQIKKPSPSFVDLLTLDDSPAPAIEADFGIQTSQAAPVPVATSNVDLLNFGNSSRQSLPNVPVQNGNLIDVGKNEAPKSAKDSILSLYGNTTVSQQPMYGVPGGLYMAPSGTPYHQQPLMNISGGGAYGYQNPSQMMALQAQMQQMQVSPQTANRFVGAQSRPGSAMAYQATPTHPLMQVGQSAFQQQGGHGYFQGTQTALPTQQVFGMASTNPTPSPYSGQPGFPGAGYVGVAASPMMDPRLSQQTNFGAQTSHASGMLGPDLASWGGGNQALAGMTYGQQPVLATGPGGRNMADFGGAPGMGGGYTMSHQLWN